jgi:CheY-like chemotaxis protein
VIARPLVLVVEDSDDTRDIFATVLHLEGFAVEAARDGREGIEKATESSPDIIIMLSRDIGAAGIMCWRENACAFG